MQCRRGTLGDDSDMTVKRTSLEAESIRSRATLSVSTLTLSLSFCGAPSVLLSSGSRRQPLGAFPGLRPRPRRLVSSSSFRLAASYLVLPRLISPCPASPLSPSSHGPLSTDNHRIRAQVRLSSGNQVK